MPKKTRCADCDKRREPHKAVWQRSNGSIEYVCRQCWRDFGYAEYLKDGQQNVRVVT